MASTIILLSVNSVGFVDVAIGYDRVPFSIDNKSSSPNIVNIISFLFFSYCLLHFLSACAVLGDRMTSM